MQVVKEYEVFGIARKLRKFKVANERKSIRMKGGEPFWFVRDNVITLSA